MEYMLVLFGVFLMAIGVGFLIFSILVKWVTMSYEASPFRAGSRQINTRTQIGLQHK